MNSEKRENAGYTSHTTYSQIRKSIGNKIDRQKFKNDEEARLKEYTTIKHEERGKDQQLTELGKICCFVEAFDNIPLNEQEIAPVGPFEDPRESKSFQKGYEIAKAFVKNGFTKDNYLSFLENYERKYNTNELKHR